MMKNHHYHKQFIDLKYLLDDVRPRNVIFSVDVYCSIDPRILLAILPYQTTTKNKNNINLF